MVIKVIKWHRHDGKVWTFDDWAQFVEECQKLSEFEITGEDKW